MKTVFNNDMCAHVWAQQTQDEGRSGNMSFRGPVAYSYRQPVARIVAAPNADRGLVALFTSHQWSFTTTRHVSLYRRAASNYCSFTVPDISGGQTSLMHSANVDHFKRRYADALAKMLRCPADSWRAREPLITLETEARDLQRYELAFGLASTVFDVEGDAARVIERQRRILNDPKRAAKREAGRLARERAEAIKAARDLAAERERVSEAAARVAAWRAGADVGLHFGDVALAEGGSLRRLAHNWQIGNILRIKGDRIETDAGAECPIRQAQFAMQLWRRIVAACATWTAISDTLPVKLGHFHLDSIDINGNARAGCHFFKRAELEHLEALLSQTETQMEGQT
jgi:hypothetical protein